jgi:methylated-DNA-protein-cysteine methyltransferase related protein
MNNDHFFSRVYQVVREIPFGRVTTYGAIANFLSTPGAARMVGWAMNASHQYPENIPAHRVVNRYGKLTGKRHFGDTGLMQQLLENEGIAVEDDTVKDFIKLFWDPVSEADRFSE